MRVKQHWKNESYFSGRIDSKTGGIHNVSYTPTSKSCKSSNKKKWRKQSTLKNVFTHVKTLWIWEIFEHLCKCKLQILKMYKEAKYWKYLSKAKIFKIWVVKKIYTENLPCKSQTVPGKFSTIHFGNRTIWYWTILHHDNVTPDTLALEQFDYKKFDTRTI